MLTKLKFNVSYADGQKVEVTSRPSTEVAFERRFQQTIATLFIDAPQIDNTAVMTADQQHQLLSWLATVKADHINFLAWHSTKSATPYDEWLELIDEVSWTFAETVDPTRPAVSDGL